MMTRHDPEDRLKAKAPDLLAACKDALALLNDRVMVRCLPARWGDPDSIRQLLRATIDEAEGRGE